jgi:hypothetical protein
MIKFKLKKSAKIDKFVFFVRFNDIKRDNTKIWNVFGSKLKATYKMHKNVGSLSG